MSHLSHGRTSSTRTRMIDGLCEDQMGVLMWENETICKVICMSHLSV